MIRTVTLLGASALAWARSAPLRPAPLVSVGASNGTEDPLVRHDGGAVARTRGRVCREPDATRAIREFFRDHPRRSP